MRKGRRSAGPLAGPERRRDATLPGTELLWAYHCSLLEGDPTAPDRVARASLEQLVVDVERRFRNVPADFLEQATIDAVWEYLRHPERCRGTSSESVYAYLRSIAQNKVLDALRRDRRRQSREEAWVQQMADEAEPEAVELRDAATTVEQDEETAAREAALAEIMEALDSEVDRRLLQLRLSGERKTSAFAEVLGIVNLPASEQRKVVKQNKDRIDKIVRRARGRK